MTDPYGSFLIPDLADYHQAHTIGERFRSAVERFDWALLKMVNLDKPLIVAGGLTPENVAEAIRETRPYAVDVASGVENKDGRKDKKKMQEFVAAVRETSVHRHPETKENLEPEAIARQSRNRKG